MAAPREDAVIKTPEVAARHLCELRVTNDPEITVAGNMLKGKELHILEIAFGIMNWDTPDGYEEPE
jgi:hypothetical protein